MTSARGAASDAPVPSGPPSSPWASPTPSASMSGMKSSTSASPDGDRQRVRNTRVPGR